MSRPEKPKTDGSKPDTPHNEIPICVVAKTSKLIKVPGAGIGIRASCSSNLKLALPWYIGAMCVSGACGGENPKLGAGEEGTRERGGGGGEQK